MQARHNLPHVVINNVNIFFPPSFTIYRHIYREQRPRQNEHKELIPDGILLIKLASMQLMFDLFSTKRSHTFHLYAHRALRRQTFVKQLTF